MGPRLGRHRFDAAAVSNLSLFPAVVDRLQQGVLNTLYLGRLMHSPQGFAANPAFQLLGRSVLDTSHLYYDGNSQGGIEGGLTTAVAPDFQRAVLGVTGIDYGNLLVQRSTDFAPFKAILESSYRDPSLYPVILDVIDQLWVRGDPEGYAAHMTSHPLPGTPSHVVLMQNAYGDFQVSMYAGAAEARTIGARAYEPALDPARARDRKLFYGIPAIPRYPFGGSVIEIWDSGPGRVQPPPVGNVPPTRGRATTTRTPIRATRRRRSSRSPTSWPRTGRWSTSAAAGPATATTTRRERVGGALDSLNAQERARLRPAPAPQRAEVMKAVLTRERFSDPGWIFERKLDGIRCVAIRSTGGVRLLSRNERSLNSRYPEVATALEQEPCERFALDGEIVAFEGSRTSFARLAQRGHRPVAVYYYVFDLTWLEGCDVRALELRTRKRLLRQLVRASATVRLTTHRNEAGEAIYAEACRKGWEGVIAKRADSPYSPARSRDWLKFKCEQGQEMVIGGFTSPRGARVELGALLVGYYDAGKLSYAGKVGTGFDQETLRDLGARLRELRRETPAFDDASAIHERGVTWTEPALVAQVAFTEWTSAGRLRHPRFLGLRTDKAAEEVVRESQ